MKNTYILIGIIVLVAIVCLVIYLNKKPHETTEQAEVVHPIESTYLGLRKQMLTLKSADLELQLPTDKETVFGAILELETGGGFVTIVSLLTGDASMYTSTGGGIIGGIKHENVKKAAIDFVTSAQPYIAVMAVDDKMDLPKTGNMKFFILTNKHRYSSEASQAEVTDSKGKLAGLFSKANDVITQLRLISTK